MCATCNPPSLKLSNHRRFYSNKNDFDWLSHRPLLFTGRYTGKDTLDNMVTDDLSVQIGELKRLAESTSDLQKRRGIEDQIEYLEAQQEEFDRSTIAVQQPNPRLESRRFTRPRTASLLTVEENQEVPDELLGGEFDRKRPSDATGCLNSIVYHASSPSCDPRFPASNLLDPKNQDIWMSTGLYPQVLVFKMTSTAYISSLQLSHSFVKKFNVRCVHSKAVLSATPQGDDFNSEYGRQDPYREKTLRHRTSSFEFDGEAADTIIIEILEGFTDFCIVHDIAVFGEARD